MTTAAAILFATVIVLASIITWFSWRRRNVALSLAASLAWLALAFWVLIGGADAPFDISNSWGVIIGAVFVIMAFIPVLTYMDNPVVRSVGNRTWTEFRSDKDLKRYEGKQPSVYDKHRADLRAKLNNQRRRRY